MAKNAVYRINSGEVWPRDSYPPPDGVAPEIEPLGNPLP